MIEDKGNGWNRALMAALVTTTLLCATASTAQTGAGETDLPGTAWLAEDIDGHGVVDRARSTMEFVKSGQVSGIAACNRYFGPVSIRGGRISFGNLAATRMMCPDAMMDQEQRFLEALSRAKRLELSDDGLILLVYADGAEPVLEFSRIVKK